MKYIILVITIFTLNACVSNTSQENVKKEEKQIINKCLELPKVGRCRGYFKSYYYDKETSSCKSSIWGGCGGNVPFKTLSSCKKTCE